MTNTYWKCVCFLATLAVVSLPATTRADSIVFDNGSYSGTQIGRHNMDPFTIYEDFTLSSPVTLTGFTWGQHDQSFVYSSTTLTIFNALPSASSLIYSGDHVATRTPNVQPVLFQNYFGFDYAITGLSLALGPGTYYFGLNNNVSGGNWSWDETTGSPQHIAGRWQTTSPPSPGTFFVSEDSVFQVLVSDGQPVPVPEPATSLLVGTGVVATAFVRRRRQRGSHGTMQ